MRLSLAAAALALPFAFSFASASTIYTYTGQTYSSFTLPYNASESVTGTFTLNTPLAANLSGATVSPVSFSFSDGAQTITDMTALNDSFGNISTDSLGNITGYDIQINNLTAGYIKINNAGSNLSEDTVRLTPGTYATANTAGSFAPTNTAVAATPEPSSLLLLGTGLLTATATLRRRIFHT